MKAIFWPRDHHKPARHLAIDDVVFGTVLGVGALPIEDSEKIPMERLVGFGFDFVAFPSGKCDQRPQRATELAIGYKSRKSGLV
jgi:hypothetical protein